jgi:hypothetical protein
VYITKNRSERVVETVDFFPTEVQLPFQSTRDLVTEAVKQLTYALTNPQPAGPFAQFGDEQLIALKKLAAIFEGALLKHKQQTTTPLLSDTSESPQMVDCAVSPYTKRMTASSPRVVEPTSKNQKTPNYHRRLQTTRCVTPITPHNMTRRSSELLKRVHDMLNGMIQQANHFFSPHTAIEYTNCCATNKKQTNHHHA